MLNGKAVIFIPTYNERENVQELYGRIQALNLDVDILFLDDNSPDGTGELLDSLAKKDGKMTVLHRSGKLGIGSAHQDGIQWAYQNKYKYLITMDCDFTHPPEYIPDLIEKAPDYDIVVGSRYLKEDSLAGWNLLRWTLTMTGHLLTKYVLKIEQDATGALRLYNLEKIPSAAFILVSSKGYSFFFESLYILNLNGFSIGEIPINLPPRMYGHSKMRIKDAWHSLMFLFAIYIQTLFNKEKFKL